MPSETPLQAGTLLVAPPTLLDPNFRRTVVLVCEHNTEGCFGLVLNRPLDVQLDEVLDEVQGYDDALSLGGPVQPETLHYLHRHGQTVPGAAAVAEGLYWGGDFDVLRALVRGGETDDRTLRFFLGYAGWGRTQLEEEIDAGGWILTEALPEEVFSETPDGLWRAVLRRMGGEYALLSNFPDNPRMN